MTDRHSGYTVVLERDIREDDAQALISAIKQLRGVLEVRPIVAQPSDFIAATRERNQIWEQIFEIFKAR